MKTLGTYRSEEGEHSLPCYSGSESRLRGSRTRRAKTMNGMKNKTKKEARKIPVDFSQTPNMYGKQ